MSKKQKLYNLLRTIPKGKVSTYTELARALKSHPRAVGKMLNCNNQPEKYPCYKIVMSSGALGGYQPGIKKKIKLLRKDGIKVKNNKIFHFEKHLFRF